MKSYPFSSTVWRAQPVYVVDGDTVDLFIDRAMYEYGLYRFRLFGVDTPELRDRDLKQRALAKKAKEYVQTVLACHQKDYIVDLKHWPLKIYTHKDPDSFGRWLAELYFKDENGVELSLSGELLRLDMAEIYEK